MKYVIGIDSGGTNYRVMAGDLEGNTLGSYTGEPANHYSLPLEVCAERINQSIDTCLAQFGGVRADACCLVCGTTGLDSDEDAEILNRLYRGLPGFSCPVKVINDAELAHYTVTGGTGVLVISGTGSIGFGRSQAGRTARAGGWMFTIHGDEGSGSWVSRAALRHVGRYLDGAAPAGPMVLRICEELHIFGRDDLNQIAASAGVRPWKIPPLGKLVNEAADAGDADARAILRESAALVFAIAEDVARALDLERTEPDFKLGVWGGNILHSTYILGDFRALAAQRFPGAQVCLPQHTALEGAVRMALESIRA